MHIKDMHQPQTTGTKKCRRCAGTGEYGQIGTCYHCNGAGVLTIYTALTAAQLAENGDAVATEAARNEADRLGRKAARIAARSSKGL